MKTYIMAVIGVIGGFFAWRGIPNRYTFVLDM